MTDYIKREDAENKLAKIVTGGDFKEIEEDTRKSVAKHFFADIPSADVVEAIPRNDRFNDLIGELLEIEAKNDIGYFTSTERRLFNAYVEDLLSMTIERAEA